MITVTTPRVVETYSGESSRLEESRSVPCDADRLSNFCRGCWSSLVANNVDALRCGLAEGRSTAEGLDGLEMGDNVRVSRHMGVDVEDRSSLFDMEKSDDIRAIRSRLIMVASSCSSSLRVGRSIKTISVSSSSSSACISMDPDLHKGELDP